MEMLVRALKPCHFKYFNQNSSLFMKAKIIFLFLFTTIVSINSFAQKVKLPLPISWKVGDTWTYQLKQRNLGGILGADHDARGLKSFQIKVTKIQPKPYPGYLIEWKYLTYITPETDTLEDDCAIMLKKYLLQNPLLIQLGEKGEYQDWIGKAEVKKKFVTFYENQLKAGGAPYCVDMVTTRIAQAGRFSEYFDALTPEIKSFFTAFSLLPCDTNEEKIDTVEVFKDYNQKIIKVPKTISIKPEVTNEQIKVSFDMRVSEPEYKKYFSETMQSAWEKEGYSKSDSMMMGMYKRLESFQPKNSHKLDAVFDKKTGVLLSFDHIEEQWLMMKGGESTYYYYRKEGE
jgi:hypothetical protein